MKNILDLMSTVTEEVETAHELRVRVNANGTWTARVVDSASGLTLLDREGDRYLVASSALDAGDVIRELNQLCA
jgi:hypothetical protein